MTGRTLLLRSLIILTTLVLVEPFSFAIDCTSARLNSLLTKLAVENPEMLNDAQVEASVLLKQVEALSAHSSADEIETLSAWYEQIVSKTDDLLPFMVDRILDQAGVKLIDLGSKTTITAALRDFNYPYATRVKAIKTAGAALSSNPSWKGLLEKIAESEEEVATFRTLARRRLPQNETTPDLKLIKSDSSHNAIAADKAGEPPLPVVAVARVETASGPRVADVETRRHLNSLFERLRVAKYRSVKLKAIEDLGSIQLVPGSPAYQNQTKELIYKLGMVAGTIDNDPVLQAAAIKALGKFAANHEESAWQQAVREISLAFAQGDEETLLFVGASAKNSAPNAQWIEATTQTANMLLDKEKVSLSLLSNIARKTELSDGLRERAIKAIPKYVTATNKIGIHRRLTVLKDSDPSAVVRKAAAEALGQIPLLAPVK